MQILERDSDEHLEDLDDLEDEPEPVKPPRRVHRSIDLTKRPKEASAPSAGSWWLDKSGDEFSAAAAKRSDELKGSKEAARLKTPMNFV